ncbi:hypothetical protein [Bradyrhizobium septentrionale]|uniref:Transposase n=1 Tax=Bradyrhizobium septentrionale TaxID=1404411 RepID=A0ABZ2NS38_9BRAD
MKPVRTSELTHTTPVDHRGHGRTPAVRLVLDERAKLLIEAARFFPGLSNRETARQLRIALARYRDGRWRRDRAELTCPPQHRGKLVQALWCLLKTRDAIPCDRTVRTVLAGSA